MLPDVDYPDNVEFHLIFSGPHVRLNNFRDSKGVPFAIGPDAHGRQAPVESSEEEGEGSEEEEEENPEEVDLSD